MKIIRNKKGAGIELAIFMLVIVFAFCSLIVSVAFSISVSRNRELEDVKLKTVLDRLGEDFLNYVADNGYVMSIPEGYGVDISKGNNAMVVTKNGEEVFTVEVNADKEIVRWQYLK